MIVNSFNLITHLLKNMSDIDFLQTYAKHETNIGPNINTIIKTFSNCEKQIKPGDIVRLIEHDYENEYRPFFYGDLFVIKSINERCFNLLLLDSDNVDENKLTVLDKHIELI